MKKALPIILVLIGAALLITAVVFWIDSSTSPEPESFGKSLRDWITLILGIGASIKGWMDLFKPDKPTPPTTQFTVEKGSPQISTGDHARNIQTQTYIENQTVQQPSEPKTPKSLNQLPAPPLDFIGREKELVQLRQNIEKGVVISGVQGMGGIGKTALGLKLAEQIAPNYPDGQIYLDLRGAHEQTPLMPEQIMVHVIRSFHPETALPLDFGELGAMYRSVLNGKKLLLFYDNARDEKQLDSLLPPKSCTLFVTSRQYFTLPGLVAIDLDTLAPKDAIELIQEISSRVNNKDAETLAKRCGFLPLAIRAAVSVLQRRPDWSPAELIKRLGDNRARLSLVESSLRLSYDSLDDNLQSRLRQLGVFAAPFEKHAASAIWVDASIDKTDELLGLLLQTGLLQYDKNTNKYIFHDLTLLFLEGKCRLDPHAGEILGRYADYYLNLAEQAEADYRKGDNFVLPALSGFRHIWLHLSIASQRLASKEQSPWKKPLNADLWLIESTFRIPYILNVAVSINEYYPFVKRGLESSRILNNLAREAWHLNYIGAAYILRGDTEQARGYLEKALTIYRDIGDNVSLLLPLGNLGSTFIQMAEPQKAVEFYEQVLEITREIGDKRSEEISLGNLGGAYSALGNFDKAIEYYKQALSKAQEIGDTYGKGNIYGNLGGAYRILGDLDSALEYHNKALEISKEISDRHGEGADWDNLANVYADKGEYENALIAYRNALDISKEVGDISMEANIAWNIATIYHEKEQYDMAYRYMQITVEFEKKINHPNVKADLQTLEEVRAKIHDTTKPEER
ncbi:MAG: tetratricopeptide repeat protein [Anaerolineales bacterium]|nr:tetratricopeptide repeat protein [Anaerolineales bacterium]